MFEIESFRMVYNVTSLYHSYLLLFRKDSMEPIISVSEAAEILRISVHTVRNWLSQGRLKRVKIGGKTFLLKSEVEDLLIRAIKG